ncbi:MAG: hypothetical protein ABR906_02950 [Terracidiphilus sp.]
MKSPAPIGGFNGVTCTGGLLEESVTVAPAGGAGDPKVTVPLVDCPFSRSFPATEMVSAGQARTDTVVLTDVPS